MEFIKDAVFLVSLIGGLIGQYFHMKNKLSVLEINHLNDKKNQEKEIQALQEDLKEAVKVAESRNEKINEKIDSKINTVYRKIENEFKTVHEELKKIAIVLGKISNND